MGFVTRKRIVAALRALPFLAMIFACPLIVIAQTPSDGFRKILRDDAAFEDSNFLALDNGEIVVKSLNGKDKKQVAVLGVVRLENAPEISRAMFIESLRQDNNKLLTAGGQFSTPPAPDDLRTLKLEDRDIEDMKKCVVGKCGLKMSAAMINRLRSEVDWNAADYKTQATDLYKRMLVDYVADYAARGDQALLQYDNNRNPVHLDDEHRALLDGTLFLDEFAPEFGKYLRNFPRTELSGVENSLDWSAVSFGLKPIVTITHTASYAYFRDNFTQYLIATKGIYSSRYVDSSLALTLLVRVQEKSSAETYIVFTNISRSDSLGGLFSGLKRDVVSSEAGAKVRDVLHRAKLRLETVEKDPVDLTPSTADSPWTVRYGNYATRPVVLTVILLSAVIVFLIYRRFRH